MKIKYLGMSLTSYVDTEEERNDRIMKANRVAGCLNTTIWYNNNLTKGTKTRIYKSVVRPILTYASETTVETTKTRQRIETTEMKVLRKIAGKTLRDRIRSANIRESCGIPHIADWMKGRKAEWNEHVSRMNDTRLVKSARDLKPEGRRRVGRPKKEMERQSLSLKYGNKTVNKTSLKKKITFWLNVELEGTTLGGTDTCDLKFIQ